MTVVGILGPTHTILPRGWQGVASYALEDAYTPADPVTATPEQWAECVARHGRRMTAGERAEWVVLVEEVGDGR